MKRKKMKRKKDDRNIKLIYKDF